MRIQLNFTSRTLDTREKKFLRGYAYDFGSGGTPHPRYFPLYGAELQQALADVSGAGFGMTTMGTVLPRFEHSVRINHDVKDAWGIPVLHIQQKYTDNEFEMAKDSMQVAEQLCRGERGSSDEASGRKRRRRHFAW